MNIVGGGAQGQGIAGKMMGASGGGATGNMMKNIGKIASIAIGVIAIVGIIKKIAEMTIKASPMLQQMLKLFNFGVMLILRPIGDFFGFFLRPIVLYFLRNIALPWFRYARPLMQQLGTWLGNQLVSKPVETILSLTPIGLLITNRDKIMQNLEGHFLSWQLSIKKWLANFALPNIAIIGEKVTKWISESFDKVFNFGTRINVFVRRWISRAVGSLPTWTAITTGIDEWITTNIGTLPTWDDITSTITSVKNSILGILEAIKQFFLDLGAIFGIGGNNNNQNNKPTTQINNPIFEFPDLSNLGTDAQEGFTNFLDWVTGKG